MHTGDSTGIDATQVKIEFGGHDFGRGGRSRTCGWSLGWRKRVRLESTRAWHFVLGRTKDKLATRSRRRQHWRWQRPRLEG